MNFIKVENSCAILKFTNSGMPESKPILMDVSDLLKCGFTHFIFDFADVTIFNSSILGFTLGLVRIIKNSMCKMYVRNLSEEARQMLLYYVKVESLTDELQELLSIENIQNVELLVGGTNGC